MKILLFGKDGQVGWELQRSLAPLGQVVALNARSEAYPADLSHPEGIAETIRRVRPSVVVNAAAYTAVDKAESEQDLLHAVNAASPGAMAQAAQEVGAWMVHYSTDYVFDGSGVRPWSEEDATGPLNSYGRSKRQGELLVSQNCQRHLVLRSSWIYSAQGQNFAKTMLRLSAEKDELRVVDDQIGSPTGADLLADVTALVLRDAMRTPSLAGTYHVAAEGHTSWYGYTRFIVEQARALGAELKLMPDAINPISSAEFATLARRPLNSRLDTSKIRAAFGLHMPPWQQGVYRMLREIYSNL